MEVVQDVVERVDRSTYDELVAEYFAGFSDRHVVFAEMYSVCAYLFGEKDIVVDDESGVVGTTHLLHDEGSLFE